MKSRGPVSLVQSLKKILNLYKDKETTTLIILTVQLPTYQIPTKVVFSSK